MKKQRRYLALLLCAGLMLGSIQVNASSEEEVTVPAEGVEDNSSGVSQGEEPDILEDSPSDVPDEDTDQGDSPNTSEDSIPDMPVGDTDQAEEMTAPEQSEETEVSGISLTGRVHVQSYGWRDWQADGGILGTIGQGKRLEALELNAVGAESEGSIEYATHVQSYGWQDWVRDGGTSGTTGQGKRLEAVRIRLTDALAEKYDIYYRAHVQSYGWLNWTSNGEKAGTAGYSKRLEAIEICIVEKGSPGPAGEGSSYVYPEISFQAHSQTVGWQGEKYNGDTAGIVGQSKRMEAIKIKLPDSEYEGGIRYQTHVQSIGWQGWKSNGEMAGTTGQGKRLEAIQIELTGEMNENYHIYYRAHVESYGWLGWAKDGEKAGTAGYGKRLEALEIRLVKDGEEAPEQSGESYKYPLVTYSAHSQSIGWQATKWDNDIAGVTGKAKRLEAIKIQIPDSEFDGGIEYRTFVQTYQWQDWMRDGQIAGTTNQAKRVEAIQIRLTGEIAGHYDVYYSVHMSKIGWTNYAKNGETAGSTDLSKRIEAVRIQLVEKNGEKPDTSGVKYIEGYKSADFTYSGTIQRQGDSGEIQMGGTLGTTGQGKRLENITLHLNRRTEDMPEGQITYATHLSSLGWQEETGLDTVNGCTDGQYGIEAVKISISGDLAKYYDIYYKLFSTSSLPNLDNKQIDILLS